MSILLLILKIIGIALLSILVILLTAIILILFVPVRYMITANKPEDGDFDAKITITWLLHFVNMYIKYSDDLYYRVRVLFFSIVKSDNLKKKKSKIKETTKIKKEADPDTLVESPDNVEQANDNLNSLNNEKTNNYENIENIVENEDIKELEEEDLDNKKTIFQKIAFVLEKFIDFIFNIKSKILNIINKLKKVYEDIDYYIDALNDEKNKETIALCFSQFSKVIKNIKPKKIKGYAHIGLDDPYSMGQMLSIYGILFPLIHDKIQIVPDYERKVIEGNLYIKGRITVFVIICAGVKIYFNKDFKRMVKIFKNEGTS